MPSFFRRILLTVALLAAGAGGAAAQQTQPTGQTTLPPGATPVTVPTTGFFGRFFGGGTASQSTGQDRSSLGDGRASIDGIPQNSVGATNPQPAAAQSAPAAASPPGSGGFLSGFFGSRTQEESDVSVSNSINGVPQSSYGRPRPAPASQAVQAAPPPTDAADASPDSGENLVVHRTRERCAPKTSDAWACYR